MSRRCLSRDLVEAKMNNNPELKAKLLVASKHRRHLKQVKAMTERAASAVEGAKAALDKVEAVDN